MKVKICGIRTFEEARAAIQAGADMLGYNFYPPSVRYITPAACTQIQAQLITSGLAVTAVGIFVNEPGDVIERIARESRLDYAQLSGDEGLCQAARLRVPWFKALRPRTKPASLRRASSFVQSVPPGLLVDAFRPGQYGGTGHVGNWELARALAERYPILLAGGLHPGNVQGAIRQVNPWGVDVASGVESVPGVKDLEKIRLFVKRAKEVWK